MLWCFLLADDWRKSAVSAYDRARTSLRSIYVLLGERLAAAVPRRTLNRFVRTNYGSGFDSEAEYLSRNA